MRNLGIILAAVILVTLCLPTVDSVGRYEVEVTWTIRESTPRDHRVTFQDTTFAIPAGQPTKQTHRLRGGSNGGPLYTIRHWSLHPETIRIDGEAMPSLRIQHSSTRGNWKILGMARSPSMAVTIEM